MKIIFYSFICVLLFSSKAIAQETTTQEEVVVYSVFNDFRIPHREEINATDLRYDGWETSPNMYTFRCKNNKRIRLTLWFLKKGTKKTKGSEFINITKEIGECQKTDKAYRTQIQ